MKLFVFLAVVFFSFSFISGGDPYVDLERIAEAWKSPNSYLQCQMEMFYYDNLASDIPIDTLSFVVKKKGKKSLVQSDEFEFLELGGESVYVDFQAKEIHVFNYPAGIKKAGSIDVISFIEMMKGAEGFEVAIKENKDGTRSMIFEAPDFSNTKMTLIYDPKNYLVQKTEVAVSLDSEPEYRVVVNYSDYRLSKKAFPYGMDSFVKSAKHGFLPASRRYKGYKVINHGKN